MIFCFFHHCNGIWKQGESNLQTILLKPNNIMLYQWYCKASKVIRSNVQLDWQHYMVSHMHHISSTKLQCAPVNCMSLQNYIVNLLSSPSLILSAWALCTIWVWDSVHNHHGSYWSDKCIMPRTYKCHQPGVIKWNCWD